jgi:hypothetical protein
LPKQASIFEDALRRAERCGLALPPRLTLEWRCGGTGVMHGVTEVTYDRSRDRVLDITVAMNAYITPDELLWTSFHELQHVADLTRRGARPPITRPARNARHPFCCAHDGAGGPMSPPLETSNIWVASCLLSQGLPFVGAHMVPGPPPRAVFVFSDPHGAVYLQMSP